MPSGMSSTESGKPCAGRPAEEEKHMPYGTEKSHKIVAADAWQSQTSNIY
jgi:hypothetical protein